ncbi:MAG: response regulator [Clostridia bacterium]
MNFTIAICDDDAAMTHYLGENIQIEFSKQNRICTPHLFTDPHKLMEQLAVMAYHMVFLDMDMPDITGFDIAKEVVAHHPQSLIVFVTSHEELVYPSLQYHPLSLHSALLFQRNPGGGILRNHVAGGIRSASGDQDQWRADLSI